MGKFIFTQTEIPGVVVIEPQVFGDDRGYFMETYQKDQFAEAGIDKEFVQDNQSRSTRGVLRGLHFQKNHTQGKLVRVTRGEVYDVAVDCRPNSATFGKWVGVTLSEENKKMFYIPEGFAHGFLVLSDVAEFCYKCTDVYDPAAEGGIAEELLRRPEISYPLVAGIIGWGEEITPMLAERLETEIKYAGYIARQDRMIREVARHEKTLIPEDFEYAALTGLTLEAREKLARIRPRNLGQAGRIPGVSPSDVAQLSIALAGKQQK